MSNTLVKVISSFDAYLFEIDLQNFINSIDPNFDIDIHYQPTSVIHNNLQKVNYSALVIMRRKSSEKESN